MKINALSAFTLASVLTTSACSKPPIYYTEVSDIGGCMPDGHIGGMRVSTSIIMENDSRDQIYNAVMQTIIGLDQDFEQALAKSSAEDVIMQTGPIETFLNETFVNASADLDNEIRRIDPNAMMIESLFHYDPTAERIPECEAIMLPEMPEMPALNKI